MSKFDDLQALGRMLDEGKVDRDEYQRLKKGLLAESTRPDNPMEGKPPGWYDDPTGKASHQAYWDGVRWTGQTRSRFQANVAGGKLRETEPDPRPFYRRGGFVVLAIVLVAIVAMAVTASLSGGGSVGQSGHEAVEAYVVCQQYVEERLKAASTADFGGPFSEVTRHNGGGEYTVERYVDAENSFGAMVRTDLTCTVQHTSGDSYRLVLLAMEE